MRSRLNLFSREIARARVQSLDERFYMQRYDSVFKVQQQKFVFACVCFADRKRNFS